MYLKPKINADNRFCSTGVCTQSGGTESPKFTHVPRGGKAGKHPAFLF